MCIGRRTIRRTGAGALFLATVAVALAAVGCGKQQEKVASTSTTGEALAAAVETPRPQAAVTADATLAAATPAVLGEETVSSDSLPPDVSATIVNLETVPGGIIEIAAQGSPDVESITLSDGRGKAQAFVYDTTAKAWRVLYRVPLKAKEGLGLSITAKNTGNRWKRVWVFPKLGQEEAPADSLPK